MGRVKEAFLYPEEMPDHIWEPTDEDLEEMASAYFEILHAECCPTPTPCDPSEDCGHQNAWEVLTPEVLARVIDLNRDWLQWTNRTTSEVLGRLFINLNFAGMTDIQAMRRMSAALWSAGYTPNADVPNPTWTFPV